MGIVEDEKAKARAKREAAAREAMAVLLAAGFYPTEWERAEREYIGITHIERVDGPKFWTHVKNPAVTLAELRELFPAPVEAERRESKETT